MKITVTEIPEAVTSLIFDAKKIVNDADTFEYLERIEPFIIGKSTYNAARKLGVDPFDLIFIGDKPFSEYFSKYMKQYKDESADVLKTAIALRKLHAGEYVRISQIGWTEHICVTEPVAASLSIIDKSTDNTRLNRKMAEKAYKNEKKNIPLSSKAEHILETLRLAAVKYSMKKALSNKELIDKYNFRRFSTNLRLLNRPANLKDINNILARRKMYTLIDLSDTLTRLNFSALYAITYGGFTLTDIYGSDAPFRETSSETDDKLSELSSKVINIIYNNNGVEISGMLIAMLKKFVEIEPPKLDITDLNGIIENYSVYYACASLANFCETIFSVNAEMKSFMKKYLIDSYWAITNKIIEMKRYGEVIALCHKLADLNIEYYRNVPSYQNELIFAFETVQRLERELNVPDE